MVQKDLSLVSLFLCLCFVATNAQGLWFERLVETQTEYVRSNYNNSNFSLLEACGGIGSEPDGRAPGACGRTAVMNGVQDISFVRLVFTPRYKTIPTVLAMINMTSNRTSYEFKAESWIGDNERTTDWKSSISLEAAHDIFSRINGTQFTSFVWRQMIYRCVFEPVFMFPMPEAAGGAYVFVGSHAARACRTATMVENATLGCHLDCYDSDQKGAPLN